MWFGFKQPFLWGERCVTSKKRLRGRLFIVHHKFVSEILRVIMKLPFKKSERNSFEEQHFYSKKKTFLAKIFAMF